MMCARTRTRPARTLPALHAPKLGGVIDLDNAIDLAVRMLVVLA